MADRSTDLFLESCGVDGPIRLVLEGPDGSAAVTREFDQPFVLVGRGPGNDLVLGHPDISRRHAYLQFIAGRLFCMDLESRTRIHWEGGPGRWGWVPAEPGIRIGPFRIRPGTNGVAERPVGASPPPTSRAFEQAGLSEITLEFLEPTAESPAWRVSRALVLLGRSRTCRVQLPGPEVSGIHASLIRTPGGVWAVHLGGRGGTFHNGASIRSARLDDGDELRIGHHRIRVRLGPSASRPAHRGSVSIRQLDLSQPPDRPQFVTNELMPAGTDALLAPLLREFGQMQERMADQFQQALMMMFQVFSGMHQDQMNLIREELARLHQLTEEQHALQAELASRSATPPDDRPILRLHQTEVPVNPGTIPSASNPTGGGNTAASAPRPSPEPGLSQLHTALFERISAIQQERQGRWQRLLSSVIGRGGGDPLL